MGLKEQLELQRRSRQNKPMGRGGKRINEAQEFAKEQAFLAMQKNKGHTQNFTQRKEELLFRLDVDRINKTYDTIEVNDLRLLIYHIAVAINAEYDQISYPGLIQGEEFEKWELGMLVLFFAKQLSFSNQELWQKTYIRVDLYTSIKALERTRNYIIEHRPELLELGKKMGIDFSTPQEKILIAGEKEKPSD